MKIIKNTICLAIFLAVCSANAQGGHEIKSVLDSMLINGLWRTFEYHVPQFPAENPRLIVVLHGDYMTTEFMQTATRHEFNSLADKNGNTIIVYPQGYKNIWNDYRKEPFFETKKKNLDDILFIKSLVQRIERRYEIDRNNVFAVGYFNGGNMCFKLAKSVPNLFKGFAVIRANLPFVSNDVRSPDGKPVSVMIINGTSGLKYPFEGRENTSQDDFLKGKVMSTNPHFDQWPKMKDNNKGHVLIPETVFRFFYQLQYSNTTLSNNLRCSINQQ